MTRALLCSVFLLSLSCSSSPTDSGNAAAGSSSTAGSSNQGHGGSSNAAAGASAGGVTNSSAGASSTAGASNGTAGGANGTAGAGGAAGTSATAGAAGVGTTGGATGTGGGAAASDSVTQWGGDIAHTAHWVNAKLTKANAAKMALDTFSDTGANNINNFAGELSALPLFLAGTTPGTGEYIAVTTQNDVYAFNETTGKLVWTRNVGANLGKGGSQCGTPTNHGIVSTPVIDATARVIYLAAGLSSNTYQIHALAADTGMEVTTAGWPVDVSKIKAGTLAFPSTVQIQRSALALVGGVVYVAFGGYCGDQGNYHGWVVAVNAKDPTQTGAWATMDTRHAGIWAPGGLASDGTGVFAVTGNSDAEGADHSTSDSEEIIRVTGMGVASHATKDVFYPTEWSPMNSGDLDFGSSSPVIMTVPGSTPSSIIVAPAKGGRVYFLNTSNLGATLGQFADMAVANTSGQSVYTAPTAYQTATGAYAALVTGAGSQCPTPVGVNNGSVMSILMQPGSPPMPKMAWCAKIGTDDSTVKRSPISTNSAGTADPLVWVLDGSKLDAFDGDTGTAVTPAPTGTCGGVHSFTTLIETNGHIVTGGDSAGQAHLCSWSVH